MPNDNIKTLYVFDITQEKEVDETTTRLEGDKTINETVKVKKPFVTHIAFKKISRAEREDADIEKASWWNTYVKQGLMPEAVLLKTYGNVGGILSDDQKKQYLDLRVKLKSKLEEEVFMRTAGAVDQEKADALSREIIVLRDEIIAFEQDQASFFENTAEAKARLKVVQFLILHLSYVRADENQPWIPFFKGTNTKDKLADYTAKEEAADELFSLSKIYLEFLAAFVFGSNYVATTADIDSYLKEQNVRA